VVGTAGFRLECTVLVSDGSSRQDPLLRLPVRGVVRPDVFAVPPALDAPVTPGTEAISFDESIPWRSGLNLEISPQPNPVVVCEPIASEPLRRNSRLTLDPSDVSSNKTSFHFQTDHSAIAVVEVPISVVPASGDGEPGP
jgi:hypothetical protein